MTSAAWRRFVHRVPACVCVCCALQCQHLLGPVQAELQALDDVFDSVYAQFLQSCSGTLRQLTVCVYVCVCVSLCGSVCVCARVCRYVAKYKIVARLEGSPFYAGADEL